FLSQPRRPVADLLRGVFYSIGGSSCAVSFGAPFAGSRLTALPGVNFGLSVHISLSLQAGVRALHVAREFIRAVLHRARVMNDYDSKKEPGDSFSVSR